MPLEHLRLVHTFPSILPVVCFLLSFAFDDALLQFASRTLRFTLVHDFWSLWELQWERYVRLWQLRSSTCSGKPKLITFIATWYYAGVCLPLENLFRYSLLHLDRL